MSSAGFADFVVAVDGTSGSGKSSASRGVAQSLGLRYLDTGAMYRAITLVVLAKRIDLGDADAIAEASQSADIVSGTDPSAPTILAGGVDISREIRLQAVTDAVSLVSAVPEVRAQMVRVQREIIGSGGIVVEGRDIATTVAPHAAVKVYLTADPGARAARRAAEHGLDLAATHESLVARDSKDSSRDVSPLIRADTAIEIDTTFLSLDEVIATIVSLAMEAIQ